MTETSEAATKIRGNEDTLQLTDIVSIITRGGDAQTISWQNVLLNIQAAIEDSGGGVILTSTKIWSFDSPSGSSGIFYFAGFYEFHSASFTPAAGQAVGSANNSYAAHALVVLGAASTDMVIRVSGTTITDAGVRTAADFEDIDTSGGAEDAYFETSKKFIGAATYTLQSGTGVIINGGLTKYWDFGNRDFTVVGCEASWLAGANDTGVDIQLCFHQATGWTYGAGGTPTIPAAIASMADDHGTENNVVNGKSGAWKRTNLSQFVIGNDGQGILWRVTTSANKAFEIGNFELTISQ